MINHAFRPGPARANGNPPLCTECSLGPSRHSTVLRGSLLETATERSARLRAAAARAGRACEFPLAWSETCDRQASVLATDVDVPADWAMYVPVCKVHMRVAITQGLERASLSLAGHRIPVSILPLDERSA